MNMWPQYERYVKISDTEHWLHSFADPGEGPAAIKFVPTLVFPDEYTMIDASDDAGRLVSFCTGACDGGQCTNFGKKKKKIDQFSRISQLRPTQHALYAILYLVTMLIAG